MNIKHYLDNDGGFLKSKMMANKNSQFWPGPRLSSGTRTFCKSRPKKVPVDPWDIYNTRIPLFESFVREYLKNMSYFLFII